MYEVFQFPSHSKQVAIGVLYSGQALQEGII